MFVLQNFLFNSFASKIQASILWTHCYAFEVILALKNFLITECNTVVSL